MEPRSGVATWEMSKYARASVPVPNCFVRMAKLLPIKIPTRVKSQYVSLVLVS